MPDTALHISIGGINAEHIFREDVDFLFYIGLMRELSVNIPARVYAYSLLPSRVSILASFAQKDDPSRFMQALGLKYVSYVNKKYHRTGTIWDGRYKSSLVDDTHVLSVMHYIESLPDLSTSLDESRSAQTHSSFGSNALAEESDFLSPHLMYQYLGKNEKDRASIYKIKFDEALKNTEIREFIKSNLERQSLTGSIEFYKKVEQQVAHSLFEKKRGRPKKSKNKQNKGKKMYKNLVALDKEKHSSFKISALEDLNFAKDIAFMPILANEAGLVAQAFPVVFTADETPSLVTLTSIGGKNLAINEEGKYIVRYVPAYLRKYPFSLASKSKDSNEKVVLIDEDASVLSKTKGKQLFSKDGEQSEALKDAIKFLSEYEQQTLNTQAVAKLIHDADILEDREISIGEGKDKKVLVNGFKVVNKEKLYKLDDATLALWVRKGIISFIDVHLNSLEKIEVLFKLANQNQQQ